MSDILISVIIPIYNVEAYLERCLKSVSEQSLDELEIICVDDGSTDNSAKILKNFSLKDPRVRIIQQSNAGQSAARNAGLKIARGKYIGFVDADDWVDEDFYKNLYQAIEASSVPIVQCGYRAVSEKKSKCRNFTSQKCEDFIESIKNLSGGFVWNKIYKRDFLLSNHLTFAEGLIFEDILFVVKAVFYAGNIEIIANNGYNYYSNPASTVNNNALTLKRQTDSLKVIQALLRFAEQQKFAVPEKQALKDFICEQLVQPENILVKSEYEKYIQLLESHPRLKQKYRRALRRKILSFLKIF